MVIGIRIIVSFFDWVYVEEAAEDQTKAASFFNRNRFSPQPEIVRIFPDFVTVYDLRGAVAGPFKTLPVGEKTEP